MTIHKKQRWMLMQCSKCNQKVNPEDKFCMYCGNNLENDGATYSEEAQITSVPHCPSCHAEVNPDDKFCMQCGFNLATASNSNFSHTESLENQTKENVSLADEAKQLFNNTTKSIGKMAGNEESLNLNLRDMFSEVFKSHSREEADRIFIAGTKETTPALKDVSNEWGRPWLFSRVFAAMAITFVLLWVMATSFENENAIPGLIFIGALTVPLSGLFFFYETNAFKNISIFEVLKWFFIGGVFSLLVTLFLYNFVSFSEEAEVFGLMTLTDAISIGIVEELGKAIIIIIIVNMSKTNKILNGLLIGAAIGAGFAVFESAGYILKFGLFTQGDFMNMIILRAWTGLGSHLVWAAIVGAAVVIAKSEVKFEFNNIVDPRFLFFFFASVILHAIWDVNITFLGSYNLKIIILIVLGWLLVFILMKAGLNQVNTLQNTVNEEIYENEK